jgi:hypothetical protein
MILEIEQMLDLCPYNIEQLTSKNRVRDLVYWRQAIMYQLREKGYKLEEIGEAMKRDHATVIHGIKKVENALNGFNRELFKINRFTQIMVTNERKYCNQIRRGKIAPTKVYKKAMR